MGSLTAFGVERIVWRGMAEQRCWRVGSFMGFFGLYMWDFEGLFGGMVWRRRLVWRCCCDKDEVFGMAWPDGMERLISRRKCEENK